MQSGVSDTFDCRPIKGFTIIEIVVVLGILALIMSGTIAFMNAIGPEKVLRETAVELESMAREAQARAIMTHTTHRIVITNNEFILLENDEVALDPKDWITMPSRKRYQVSDPDIFITVYRWGFNNKYIPSFAAPMIWLFPPDGFVEPISIQFSIGPSFLKQTYHPLTASVTDEEMEVQ